MDAVLRPPAAVRLPDTECFGGQREKLVGCVCGRNERCEQVVVR